MRVFVAACIVVVSFTAATTIGQLPDTASRTSRAIETDPNIIKLRKNDIHIRVTTAAGINKNDVEIHVLQTKKSFPFGTEVNTGDYNRNAGGGKYRDFIHKYFNWAVPGNSLKWWAVEPHQGDRNFKPALDMIHGVRAHGLKVRGHNLVWSVPATIQDWVKALRGDALRNAINHHIVDTLQATKGLCEHWDVNNEQLHGHWFTDTLHDPNFNIELHKFVHQTDPNVKMFLNEYNVVAAGYSTTAYLHQAQQMKAANTGLYGIGAQCHFAKDIQPDTSAIKSRLDTLAQAGLPIWITEFEVVASSESTTADFLERALTAVYSHHAVEGIMIWMRPHLQYINGNFDLTQAGRRLIDLLTNKWMTDESHRLSQAGDQFTVRGFHGDYEVHVIYQGRELTNLKTTFTLNKGQDHTVNINVHT